jgi:molecular chaperone GrpE
MSSGAPGPESASWPASGGQQDADSATEPESTSDPQVAVAEEAVSGGAGSDGDTADRFPPEAGREAGSSTEADSLRRERDEYRDGLQRLQADFENYRKRVAKQSDELRDRAAESLVEKLLPVLDTCDLALSHGAGEEVKQLSASLFAVLEKEGLEKIDHVGEPFDPTQHDAVAHEPGDGDGGQEVAEVLRAGYRWRGRVLRPAMVKVRG